ncbi:4-hydroxythreonine-4-phosphate dehydrogenase PdxA, partial [Escherichia coli]|nr:4-hydroxythreonine-4-phosphate dehydrogenase PdxA [Escherichia coli]
TAPINKDEMLKHGFKHAGHTGFLEEKFGKKGLMFLVTEDLKVAVVTHHIPISEVAQNISKERIKTYLNILNTALVEDFCIAKPKIAVLGLNP